MSRGPEGATRSDVETASQAAARIRDSAFVSVADLRPDGDGQTCLRPLGLCELGGSCESCWYRPDHPRFRD